MAARLRPAALGVGVPIALVLLALLDGTIQRSYPYWWQILMRIGIWIVLAVSLNLINGITGQFSLGHMGFAAVGGYTAAMITTRVAARVVPSLGLSPEVGSGVLFLAATVCGGLLAAVAGVLVGLPTLRLRGDYLAIATLGFGEIVRVVILNVPALGGAAGLKGIPPLTNLFWVYAWAAATVAVVHNIRYSHFGRSLLAIREDEVAAEAMGVDTTRCKVVAFSTGAFFAGVAGALLGHFLQILDPAQFGFLYSIEVVVMVVVGGLGSTPGAVFGAVALTYLSEALREAGSLRMVLYSAMLIAIMLACPTGLAGLVGRGVAWWRKRGAARKKPVAG